jgi:LysR family transcriptional activator of mexEF-oprN operon
MGAMQRNYGRDLDLNLLRVFAVVADEGSVTAAAARLYLTQPAVSAALKRLAAAVGSPLFVRQGRGVVLTARGERLVERVRPELEGLVDAVLAPPSFDPKTSDATVRIGLADSAEDWLLSAMLRALEREAPAMRLVVIPVQFRTIGALLAARRVDVAVTVADELPVGTRRQAIFTGGFSCVFDPRHVRLPRKPTLARYLEHQHVVVSYNGDLRGLVEDVLGVERRVRVSVASFQSVGPVVEGSALLATVPDLVARCLLRRHPRLRAVALPFVLGQAPLELVWRAAVDEDDAHRFVRAIVVRCVERFAASGTSGHKPAAA